MSLSGGEPRGLGECAGAAAQCAHHTAGQEICEGCAGQVRCTWYLVHYTTELVPPKLVYTIKLTSLITFFKRLADDVLNSTKCIREL